MKAIFNGKLFTVADDTGAGVILESGDAAPITVDYGDPGLIVDPTDAQYFAAQKGEPIPDEEDGEPDNVPCWKCKRTDLPLLIGGTCPECGPTVKGT